MIDIVQGSFSPNIRFLGQKVCSVARTGTDRQIQKWKQRTPSQGFRIFLVFLQPIHIIGILGVLVYISGKVVYVLHDTRDLVCLHMAWIMWLWVFWFVWPENVTDMALFQRLFSSKLLSKNPSCDQRRQEQNKGYDHDSLKNPNVSSNYLPQRWMFWNWLHSPPPQSHTVITHVTWCLIVNLLTPCWLHY